MMETKNLKKWIVCLDLSKMDEVVLGYVNFLAERLKPESIHFLHVVQSVGTLHNLIEEFPELESEEDLYDLMEKQVQETIDEKFTHKDIETGILMRKGSATDQIIKMMEADWPDLLILGKKNAYKGEGVLARRVVKYVPCSVLFVPETARQSLDSITVPVDFSEQSVWATKFALEMVKEQKGQVVAQHLFDYPKQYFPYMPDKKTMKKIDEDVKNKKAAFQEEFKKVDDLDVELTLQEDGKMSDNIYDLCITNQTDLIVVWSKARSTMLSMLKDKLPDRMANYQFSIPLLILKSKERNKKMFLSFLKG